ncbi:hypothetical protein AG0111_0g1517 [Alternaria gaisen]|uniref:Uncharacterized protein n=1 Tax=Alternaria gaisen TaxID=167740 RepID=A0ACB6FZR5_9PLEO|nr:hypothetical protein AG0111_0g1517 [Alternaria gaisen]
MHKIQGDGYNVGTRLSSYHGTIDAPAIRFFTWSRKHTSFTPIQLPIKQVHGNPPPIYRQFGAMMDMEWELVSRRRYAAHFSLCVLTVYISNLIAQTPFPTAMIWGGAPYIGLIVSLATQFGPPGVPASQMYCTITAVMLLYLNKAATALGKAAEPTFDNTGLQHHAVHFAIAFFVLSELEYRRQYIMTKGMEHFRSYPLEFLLADIDHTFDVSRHPSQPRPYNGFTVHVCDRQLQCLLQHKKPVGSLTGPWGSIQIRASGQLYHGLGISSGFGSSS